MNGVGAMDHDKENRVLSKPVHKTPLPARTQLFPPLSQRSTGKDSRDCPQTPVGRLPLAELLANNDENKPLPNGTPMERVMWESVSISSSLASIRPSQKRKRATSHSPPSSSEKRQDPVSRTLKTPKMEPADDLWNRLTLNTTHRRSPSAAEGPNFANFLQSSSPQTPATTTSRDGKLRRTLSCIDWPTSTAKRRKLYHDSDLRTSTTNFPDSVEKSKLNRVSALVEKMHRDLAKPTQCAQDSSSSEPAHSSPTRDTYEAPKNLDPFDQGAKHQIDKSRSHVGQIDLHKRQDSCVQALPRNQIPELPHVAVKDSFGLDEDMNESLLQVADAGQQEISAGAVLRPDEVGSANAEGDRQHEESQQPHGPPKAGQLRQASAISHTPELPANDEFDDDIEDEFAADLEDVFARYESQQPHSKGSLVTDPTILPQRDEQLFDTENDQNTMVDLVSDDEDFENDSDFDQLAVECADATQKANLSVGTQLYVTLNVSFLRT